MSYNANGVSPFFLQPSLLPSLSFVSSCFPLFFSFSFSFFFYVLADHYPPTGDKGRNDPRLSNLNPRRPDSGVGILRGTGLHWCTDTDVHDWKWDDEGGRTEEE